jgi:uroporphyrinogen decarboxylase
MAKNADKFVVYHSDGNITDVLDSLLEMGVNAVNPLQPEFNDFDVFKSKYHGKLAVYGGIDNTKIIPTGTTDEVRAHIRDIYARLGVGGGLILSSHDIPIYCPHENIEAMVDEILSLKK